MKKKGVELSVNVIIIAAIALIVLVLLAFLVLRTGPKIIEGSSCESIGGSCREACNDNERRDITSCSKDQIEQGTGVCCVPA